MAAALVEAPPAPAVPDFLSDPDAVLKDTNVTWRLGRAPDYTKTRKYFEESECPSFFINVFAVRCELCYYSVAFAIA